MEHIDQSYKPSAIHACDFYKTGHRLQYPEGTTEVYSNFTPRSVKHLNVEAEFYDGCHPVASYQVVNEELAPVSPEVSCKVVEGCGAAPYWDEVDAC